MSSSCITTISNCANYSISRICLPDIYQGDNASLELTLLDKISNGIDLTSINSIEILLYGLDKSESLHFSWPDVTGDEEINIKQTGIGTSMMYDGVIRIFIPASYTTNLVSGDLYATIRIKRNSIVTGREDIITFSCFKIANIKYTKLNFQ
jgi:hypothetical protein